VGLLKPLAPSFNLWCPRPSQPFKTWLFLPCSIARMELCSSFFLDFLDTSYRYAYFSSHDASNAPSLSNFLFFSYFLRIWCDMLYKIVLISKKKKFLFYCYNFVSFQLINNRSCAIVENFKIRLILAKRTVKELIFNIILYMLLQVHPLLIDYMLQIIIWYLIRYIK